MVVAAMVADAGKTRTCSSLGGHGHAHRHRRHRPHARHPEGSKKDWYEFLRAGLMDEESKDEFEFPAQYMFKDVPDGPRRRRRPGRRPCSTRWTTSASRRRMIGVGFERRPSASRPSSEHPDRFFGSLRGRPQPGHGRRPRPGAGRTRRSASRRPPPSRPAAPAGADQRQEVLPDLRQVRRARHPDLRAAPACPGPRVPMACQKTELIDEVCWFFPELKFVMRHGAEPWADLAVKLMLKWPNLYYSTSAFAPEVLPAGDHRLRQHPRRRQDHVRRLLPDGPVASSASSREMPDVAVQGRRLAQVPPRERRAGLQARRD